MTAISAPEALNPRTGNLNYLTTHDLVWINSLMTGRQARYNYVAVEAAIGAQYGYGRSQDVLKQATSFLAELIKARPFESCRRRTALLATLTFLDANGLTATASDSSICDVTTSLDSGTATAEAAVVRFAPVASNQSFVGRTLREIVMMEISIRNEALSLLEPGDR